MYDNFGEHARDPIEVIDGQPDEPALYTIIEEQSPWLRFIDTDLGLAVVGLVSTASLVVFGMVLWS